MVNSKIMQTTSDDHDQIRKTIFRVTQHILYASRSLDARNGMFDPNTHLGYFVIARLFLLGQLFLARLFFG